MRLKVLLPILLAVVAVFILFKTQTPEHPTPKIELTEKQALQIGQRIWQNEGAGKEENLIVWNKGEDFPSLGIGHFIWYPENVNSPFTESFPALVDYLSLHTILPSWLHADMNAPWNSRQEFQTHRQSKKTLELQTLLANTVGLQTEFIIRRLEAALPKMLDSLKNDHQRQHVRKQFYRVANSLPNGPYALIDYVNFKGEGVSPKERYQGQGWGLLQVLMEMDDNANDVMQEFSHAADVVLTRRVENAPRDESRWLPGWRKRLATYTNSGLN